MVKEELIQRSPLRVLERSLQGGIGAGKINVIASPKGVGKTAVLVHLATDQLFQGRHVVHVSFSAKTDHIISWYEDIFKEIAMKRDLADALEVHDDIIRNRVIMNFSQRGLSAEQFLQSLEAMIVQGGFAAKLVVVDGYDFDQGHPESIAAIRAFAEEHEIAFWFSASTEPNELTTDRGVPKRLERYDDHIDVLIALTPAGDHVLLHLLKENGNYPRIDMELKLDSRSLLIVSE